MTDSLADFSFVRTGGLARAEETPAKAAPIATGTHSLSTCPTSKMQYQEVLAPADAKALDHTKEPYSRLNLDRQLVSAATPNNPRLSIQLTGDKEGRSRVGDGRDEL